MGEYLKIRQGTAREFVRKCGPEAAYHLLLGFSGTYEQELRDAIMQEYPQEYEEMEAERRAEEHSLGLLDGEIQGDF